MTTGQKLRDEGTAQVLSNAPDVWRNEMHAAIKRAILRGTPFTSEDLLAEVTTQPHHPNAVGGFILHAVKNYDLTVVGYCRSTKPSSRAHVLAMYLKND
jgi:hypothetical protein